MLRIQQHNTRLKNMAVNRGLYTASVKNRINKDIIHKLFQIGGRRC